MAEQKLFAGSRIRRVRKELELTQAAMAASLGISPSYLNLIERNQRPLTAPVLLALASVHDVDLGDLGRGGGELTALREAFADPLLSGEIASVRELADVTETAPDVAAAVGKLHRAYREALDRLSDLSGLLSEKGIAAPSADHGLPIERFRAVVETRPCHHPELDDAAERLWLRLLGKRRRSYGIGRGLFGLLAEWLEREHRTDITFMPASSTPLRTMHHDRHHRRLRLSDALSAGEHLVALAGEVMRLHSPDAIAADLNALARDETDAETDEVRRLVHAHLVRVAGHALAMPYRAFFEEASRMRYDCAALAAHFQVGIDHAARRLVSLGRINQSGPPFFLLAVDGAGHAVERLGAKGFPSARFGGGCVKLPVHDLTGRPSETRVRRALMPDGTTFTMVSHGLQAQPHGHDRPMPRRAVMLGLEGDATGTVYHEPAANRPPIEIGLACRVCERQGCPVRAEPAITRPAGLNPWVAGPTMWDFE